MTNSQTTPDFEAEALSLLAEIRRCETKSGDLVIAKRYLRAMYEKGKSNAKAN
jgi:hypothetical protein